MNGQVLTGANAIGGEWGHNPLPAPRDGESPGPACYCGRSSCIEQFLSGPALFSDRIETRLVRAKHGDSSGARGAAWLWDSKF